MQIKFETSNQVRSYRQLKALLWASVATLPWLPATGWAQSTADSGSRVDRIEEIMVTAQKRVQSLDDLGMSVAVLSGDTFTERQITEVEALANIVPGFSFTKTNTTAPVFTLRGVGFFDNGISAYPTVTAYLDEAPLPFSVMAQNMMFDLERLEVLKGPQGTLFGSNATGGGMNFVAAKPTEEFDANITLGFGRFNEKRADGYISGPITDTLRGRLAFQWVDGDDWQFDPTTGAETGQSNVAAARGTLEWQPTEAFRASLTVSAWRDKSTPQAAQFAEFRSQNIPVPPNAIDDVPLTPLKPRAAGFSNALRPDDNDLTNTTPPFGDKHQEQVVLRLDYDVLDDVTSTSLSSFANFDQTMALDRDGVSLEDFDLPFAEGHIESWFQEIRIANAGDSDLRWVAGANYSKDDVFENYTMAWADSTTRIAFDPPFLGRSGYRTRQDMENWAVFGNIEYDLADFTFKGGVRYTENDRFAAGCNYDVPGFGIAPFFTGLSQIARQVLGLPASPDSQVQPGACSLIDTVGILGNAPTGLPLEDQREVNENSVSWRVGVDWRATEEMLLFANVAKGFKAGSIPGAPSTFNDQMVAVTQESVLAYEIGLKSNFLDGRVSANATGFLYDYQDKQLRTRFVNPVFGLLDRLENVPKSKVTGFELELAARPTNGLSLYANYLFLDDRISDFFGVNDLGVIVDLSGEDMPFAPDHQLTVGGDYEVTVTDSLLGFVGADYNYRSKTSAVIGGSSTFDIGGYGTLDLRAGISSEDNKWRLWVWGKNVTNKYYWNNVSQVFDTIIRYAGQPASYGVSISYNFN